MARPAPAFGLRGEPAPAVAVPQLLAVVAAVVDELDVLVPGDGLGVDLELGHVDAVRRALLRKQEAAVLGQAELPACGRQQQRLARDGGGRLLDVQRQAQRLRQHHELFAAQVFMEEREPVEVQAGIGLGGVLEQLERALEGFEQVGLGLAQARQVGRPAAIGRALGRVPPVVGVGVDGGQPRGAHGAVDAEGALGVAPDPPFGEPADVARQPDRRHHARLRRHAHGFAQRLFEQGQQVQRVVARVDEGQREQVAAGAAHVGRVDRQGRARRTEGRRRRRARRHGPLWRPPDRPSADADSG
ncbi:hypothetical protein D3C71_414960 [compost metagenome]